MSHSTGHATQPNYRRFTRSQRVEHAVMLVSFTVLALSGLPQKYPDTAWADWLFLAMGGVEPTRIIHRVAAVLMMLGAIYHGGVVTYKVWVKRVRLTMMPGWRDVTDLLQTLRYGAGLAQSPPRMGRYNFGEKAEYWAVVWGSVVMIITGFILWNPIATTNVLPGQIIPAARAAHGGEAVLAVLSILTWHFYNVHLKTFNRSMFTGRLSHHLMEEEHAEELAEIEAGYEEPEPPPEELRRRRRVFYPANVHSVA